MALNIPISHDVFLTLPIKDTNNKKNDRISAMAATTMLNNSKY